MFDYKKCITNAINFCISSSKDCSSTDDVIGLLKSNSSFIHSKFRFSIAKEIAAFLFKEYPDLVEDVKLYGSTMEYTAAKYSDIDILIQTKEPCLEIKSILKEIDSLLCREYYYLICEDGSEWTYLLDIHVMPLKGRHPSRALLEHILANSSVPLVN